RHFEGPDLLGVLFAGDIGGADDGARRRPAGAHDDAGALVDDLAGLEPCVADGLVHGNVVPADARFHEAPRLAWDHALPLQLRLAVHLATEAQLGVSLGADDAGLALPQRGKDLLGAVSDRGNDAHAGDYHASHWQNPSSPHRAVALAARTASPCKQRLPHAVAGCSPASNSPTRRSEAV